ncbi:MAG: hypothetical protein L0Z73_15445 [Gammaproteobacteria bacterium]|nr:hypothetical protein [Gammaproteobacteria bacterium]
MKQLIDTHSDIDTKFSLRRLLPLPVLCLAIMVSSPTIAADIDDVENTKIVAAMYGFQNPEYMKVTSIPDASRTKNPTHSIYDKKKILGYSSETEYGDSFTDANHRDAPSLK